jgi:hypothetical protein
MRLAKLYLRTKDLLINAQSQTTTGAWILSSPVTRLGADCPNDALGAAVRAAIQGSRAGVPHPKVFKGLSDPLYELAKVKDWLTFVKGAKCVSVREDAGTITLTPMRNLGAKEGFQEEPPSALSVADSATPDALGEALRAALARAV